MDYDLRALLTSSITVRRATAKTRTMSETLGAPVTLPAYYETRVRHVPSSTGVERVTVSTCVIDAADVAASALITLSNDDRFWPEGTDPTAAAFGRRPAAVTTFKDPDTGILSHYEVTL